MKTNLAKHIIIRVIMSSILLFLLYLAQIDYEIVLSLTKIGMNESAIALIGSSILFVWLIFIGVEMVKYFKNKLKWFSIANVLIVMLTIVSFAFVQLIVALACC